MIRIVFVERHRAAHTSTTSSVLDVCSGVSVCVCVCTRTHRSAVDPQAGPVVRHHEEVLVHGLAEAGPVELGRDHGGHLACMRGQRRERRGERLSQLWWTRAGTAEDQQQTTHALAWRYAQYREENIATFLVSQISVHYLQNRPFKTHLDPPGFRWI